MPGRIRCKESSRYQLAKDREPSPAIEFEAYAEGLQPIMPEPLDSLAVSAGSKSTR